MQTATRDTSGYNLYPGDMYPVQTWHYWQLHTSIISIIIIINIITCVITATILTSCYYQAEVVVSAVVGRRRTKPLKLR